MTRDEIIQAVQKWQERLRLLHWEIDVNFDRPPESDSACACCCISSDYEQAEIRLASNWREWTTESAGLPDSADNLPPRSFDRVIAHKLLHILFHDLHCAGQIQYGLLTRDVDQVHEAELERQLERTIERVAILLTEDVSPQASASSPLAPETRSEDTSALHA